MQRWLRIGFFSIVAAGVFLLIYAVAGGAASTRLGRFFPTLIAVNVLTTLILLIIVLRLSFQLYLNWRHNDFGSRMTARLALTIWSRPSLSVDRLIPGSMRALNGL